MAVVVPTLERAVVLVMEVSKERRVLLIFLCFLMQMLDMPKLGQPILAYG